MGRRYYCDYCDKSFIDDLDARKKHLSSSYHIKQRNLHYDLHREPRTFLEEESSKTACGRFFQNGDCQFAGNCKYTHYTQEELWTIKRQIELQEYEKRCKLQAVPEVPNVESWLEKYTAKASAGKKGAKRSDPISTPGWSYPEHLECRIDLPPSLKRFKLEDFKNADFPEWGSA